MNHDSNPKAAPYIAYPGSQMSDAQTQSLIEDSVWGDAPPAGSPYMSPYPGTSPQMQSYPSQQMPPMSGQQMPMQQNMMQSDMGGPMNSDMAQTAESQMIAGPDTPETLTNPIYTPAFLAQNIGKLMRVEFLIGDQITDRVGRLLKVGASYILLRSIEPTSVIMCDLYSIKFVTIVGNNTTAALYNGRI